MLLIQKIFAPLYSSASHLGFINPHTVEVASIGTVPRTFALFLFYYFEKVERIIRILLQGLFKTWQCIALALVDTRTIIRLRFKTKLL